MKIEQLDNYLPTPGFGSTHVYRGRNLSEGYIRGWGLQFAGLLDKVKQDPLYQRASKLAEGRSVLSVYNRANIFLIMKFYLNKIPAGNIIEFGSYLGGNALFMAYVAENLYPGRIQVFGLDTFEGMPRTDGAVDAHKAGDFGNVNFDELKNLVQKVGIRNLTFIKGLFQDTANEILLKHAPFVLAHIDCDIRSAVAYSYDVVKEHMVPGGYIVFDDATQASCIGATEAVEELVIRRDGLHSEQIFPHFVFRKSVLSLA
jgi:predicted O-methyltransferase YrrM